MSIALPDHEPVIFGQSPLEEVVCQLRFHPILRINAEAPAGFQERIRQEFPVFGQERGIQLGIAGDRPVLATNEPVLQFKSADEAWTVSLAGNFIALKTVAYSDFDDFMQRLQPVVAALEAEYKPPLYTRVGLRYVNHFFRERPEGNRVAWGTVLNPVLACAFEDPVLGPGIAEAKHHLVLQSGRGQIGWRYSRDIGQADGKPAERFTLDFDHYAAGQIQPADVSGLLAEFNDNVFRLFCWCLSDDGYAALGPEPKREECRFDSKSRSWRSACRQSYRWITTGPRRSMNWRSGFRERRPHPSATSETSWSLTSTLQPIYGFGSQSVCAVTSW